MKKLAIVLALLLLSLSAQAGLVPWKLHLNPGSFTAVDSTGFPYLAFNETSQFSMRNAQIRIAPGDTLRLTLVNHDSLTHGFSIQGVAGSLTVTSQDSATADFILNDAGSFLYFDPEQFPRNHYLGAGGVIAVTDGSEDDNFYWSIREHQSAWNIDLANGQTVNWGQFRPDYFTINGLSKPDIEADSSAKIRGGVGDRILIHVANNGRSTHSIHFHGYHVRVLYDSQSQRMLDWEKDTLPIRPRQSLTLELVPDKPGLFPVHDHNLTALTGATYYPNGIFLMMEVQ